MLIARANIQIFELSSGCVLVWSAPYLFSQEKRIELKLLAQSAVHPFCPWKKIISLSFIDHPSSKQTNIRMGVVCSALYFSAGEKQQTPFKLPVKPDVRRNAVFFPSSNPQILAGQTNHGLRHLFHFTLRAKVPRQCSTPEFCVKVELKIYQILNW